MNARAAIAGMVLALLALAPSAAAHTNDDAAVAMVGGQAAIVFENHMRYGYAAYGRYAVREWKKLNDPDTPGGVRIRNARNTDLPTTLLLYSYCAYDGYHGGYYSGYDPDRLYLNRCQLTDNTEAERRGVAVHEFGHALRLEHPPQTEDYRDTSVMYAPSVHTDLVRPGPHDREDYRKTWGR
jgi:hypothetical protein